MSSQALGHSPGVLALMVLSYVPVESATAIAGPSLNSY